MEEKYYIDIDENRKIIGRYLRTMHGENIPSTAQEVSEEEREKLWIEKLDKGKRWIGGTCVKRKNYKTDEEFEKACITTLEERRREALS